MCIIVAVPAGIEIPSDETLKQCFRSNSDGAGFMWSDGKRVNIRKGFMTWESFKAALDAELDAGHIYTDSAVVLHFRITTSGKTQPKCCHPFPISSDKAQLQATSTESRFGIAHNGVIHGRNTYDGWSDTMDFVASVVAPLARMHPSFMYSDDAMELLKGACLSKLAIINHAGEMRLVGEFKEDGGVFFSNTSYLPTVWSYSTYSNIWSRSQYGLVDDDELAWDAIEKQVAELKYEACQLCGYAHECAEWEEFCSDELEAVETCADSNGCTCRELLELLGADDDEEEEEWTRVYTLD